MPVQLRGGAQASDMRLGRIPRFDERSRGYPVRRLLTPRQASAPRSYTWRCNLWLAQQGSECTGYSRAHDLAARPLEVPSITSDLAVRLYRRAQQLDPWEGEEPVYEGSSVLAAVQAARELGYIRSYWWAFTLEEFLLAQGHRAPAVVGVNWHQGMWNTDALGFISPTGPIDGGHAILVYKQKLVFGGDGPFGVDIDASYIEFHNSWGSGWGANGRAKMTVRNFDMLRRASADVSFASNAVPTI